jgi:hypothetical protein
MSGLIFFTQARKRESSPRPRVLRAPELGQLRRPNSPPRPSPCALHTLELDPACSLHGHGHALLPGERPPPPARAEDPGGQARGRAARAARGRAPLVLCHCVNHA